ncbi:MAG: fumarylacetoacetate hydrolase family protein [Actinomycetales bacterium]
MTEGGVVDVDDALAAAGVARPTSPTVRELLVTHGTDLAVVSEAVDRITQTGGSRTTPIDSLQVGPPVPDPAKVLCIGLNYQDHVAETGRALPKHPDVFVKFASSLIGPQALVRGRDVTDQLDFEGELAIVIGREAREVKAADALDVIAGVTVLNDITARDLQYRGTQWTIGKAVDGSTPVGPALVTLDEVPDLQALELRTRVNGVEMQHSNTRYMIFPVANLIEYVTRTMSLLPGDVIATGTPQGIGAKRTPPVWLQSGDVVEVELDQVGTLRSAIA